MKNAHNKITLTLLLGLCTLLLGACGQNPTNTTSSNTKITDNSSNAKKHSTAKSFYSKNSSNQSSSVWNDTKDDKLGSFMVTWGQTMKQSYTQCTPDRNTTYTGLHYPNDFSDNKTAFSNHKLSAGWSPDGSNKYKVNVVAIYEDTNGGSTIGGRIYLFTIQDHTPIVYYTEQNQGTPDGLVHFEPTQNTDLSNGFKNIVNSQKRLLQNLQPLSHLINQVHQIQPQIQIIKNLYFLHECKELGIRTLMRTKFKPFLLMVTFGKVWEELTKLSRPQNIPQKLLTTLMILVRITGLSGRLWRVMMVSLKGTKIPLG